MYTFKFLYFSLDCISLVITEFGIPSFVDCTLMCVVNVALELEFVLVTRNRSLFVLNHNHIPDCPNLLCSSQSHGGLGCKLRNNCKLGLNGT